MSMTALPYFSGFEPVPPSYQKKLWQDALPEYFKAGKKTKAIAICVHGFTGTAYDVKPVARACLDMGFDAVTPLLPGHGYEKLEDQKREFPKMNQEGLLEAIRQEIFRARQEYDIVVMFGMSMGGAIALTLASEGILDACAVAAPALRLPLKAEILSPLVGWVNFFIPTKVEEPFYVLCYPFYHSWAVKELWKLSRRARRSLRNVTCPTLVVHSHNDKMIPPIVAHWIQKEVPEEVEVQWFERSGHCFTLDVQGKEVSGAIARFFRSHVDRRDKV